MNIAEKPTRPMLRYHGGKWKMAGWIISHFPRHRVYVEPYGGAGSVLIKKPRVYAEVYNDLNGEVVNLFRVVRTRGAELRELLKMTPFARDEYRLSFEVVEDPLEQARRTVIRSFMGFGSNSLCRNVKSGFRSNSNRSGTTPAYDWANFPDALPALICRLQGVVIENRLAMEVMRSHDGPETLFYCDPPYMHGTRTDWAGRGARAGYDHEMSDADHAEMAAGLRSLRGMVVLSGYNSQLYDRAFSGWGKVEKETKADGARPRLEALWLNPACVEALRK